MNKKNVMSIEKDKTTQCFSYEVKMLVHVIGTNEEDAKKELDEKGGIVTKREVQLLNTVTLYGEKDKK
jgi:hypothetical protein